MNHFTTNDIDNWNIERKKYSVKPKEGCLKWCFRMTTQNMNNVELYLNDTMHRMWMSIARSTYNCESYRDFFFTWSCKPEFPYRVYGYRACKTMNRNDISHIFFY